MSRVFCRTIQHDKDFKNGLIARAGDYWCCTKGHRVFKFMIDIFSGSPMFSTAVEAVGAMPKPVYGAPVPTRCPCGAPIFKSVGVFRPALIEQV